MSIGKQAEAEASQGRDKILMKKWGFLIFRKEKTGATIRI